MATSSNDGYRGGNGGGNGGFNGGGAGNGNGSGNNGISNNGNGRRRCPHCGGNVLLDVDEDIKGRLVWVEKCLQCSRVPVDAVPVRLASQASTL